MRKLIILFVLISLFSCNSDKINKLERQIEDLKTSNFNIINDNQKLKDTIDRIHKDSFTSYELIGITDDENQPLAESNKFNFKFISHQKFEPYPYKVYEIKNIDGKEKRNLLFDDRTEPNFYHEITPKNQNGETLRIEAHVYISDEYSLVTMPWYCN